jgi:fructokinase
MILCCGEALIDMIESTNSAGQSSFAAHAGGAVFNTAIALGRLRAHSGFLSGLSSDLFGMKLQQALNDSHVATDHALVSDRPTTLAFVRLTNGHASYTFYDENTAGRMLDPDMVPDLSDEVSALYFGGISLISEPCADFYAALAHREASDRVIAIDPNIRPTFIKDIDRYRTRLKSILSVADIVKVSDEDIHWIVPGSASLAEKAATVLALGPKVLILTKGAEGALAMLASGSEISVPAQKVDMVDTVGAGDTFNAGFLAKLAELGVLSKQAIGTVQPDQIEQALTFGALVAGITVSRAGANPPWAHELPGASPAATR